RRERRGRLRAVDLRLSRSTSRLARRSADDRARRRRHKVPPATARPYRGRPAGLRPRCHRTFRRDRNVGANRREAQQRARFGRPRARTDRGRTAEREGAALLSLIRGGRVIDPANARDEIADLWIRDGRIIAAPDGVRPDEVWDAGGKIVMAGAIDIHSHIASDNVNRARLLLPAAADVRKSVPPTAFETGRLYAAMGF